MVRYRRDDEVIADAIRATRRGLRDVQRPTGTERAQTTTAVAELTETVEEIAGAIDTRVPKAPTGLTASSDGGWSLDGLRLVSHIDLEWDAVTEGVDGDPITVAEYIIRGRLSSESEMRDLTATLATEIRLTDFTAGQPWVLEVVAVSGTRVQSAASSTASVTTAVTNIPMGTPSTPTAASSKGLLRITWDGLIDGIAPPPQFRFGYVEVKTATGGAWAPAGALLGRAGGDVVVDGLTVGTSYIARLTAVDGAGVSSAASASSDPVTVVGVDTGDLADTVAELLDGITSITYSEDEPTDPGVQPGDTWFQTDAGTVIGQWEWDGSDWNPVQVSHLSATAIDGRVITGATVQTSTDADRGVKLTGSVFVAYDAGGQATFLLDGATGAVYFADGIISGDALIGGSITASKLDVGSVVASLISSELGTQLDLASNDSVNIIVGDAVAGVQGDVDALGGDLALMQTYYQFGASGALITKPGSPFAVRITNDRIEMLANGTVVSYWTAGSMVVPSLVANDTAIIGAHQWRKEGARTTVRALT